MMEERPIVPMSSTVIFILRTCLLHVISGDKLLWDGFDVAMAFRSMSLREMAYCEYEIELIKSFRRPKNRIFLRMSVIERSLLFASLVICDIVSL